MVSRRDSDEPTVQAAFWETLRQDPADPREIARAYWRFTRASAPRRARFGFGRWLVVGFIAGAGVVSAATVARHVVARWTTVTAREGSKASLDAATHTGTASRRRGMAAPPKRSEAESTVPSAVAPDGVPSDTPPLEPPPLALPVPSVQRPAFAPPRDDLGAAAVDPKWRRVSDALRVNDYARAEGALRDLEAHGTPSDRESASLSLAQILASRGRATEARPRLERLSGAARSSLVREKARTMLRSLETSADRSTSRPPDTH